MSFVDADISMLQMRPLGTRQIVAFVNYFVVRSVQMVQSFISAMEQRIIKMEKRLSRVEVELKLLELKLDSIPDLQITVGKTSEFSKKQHHDGSADNVLESATNEAAKLVNAESASNSIACVENALESTVSKASADENDYFRIRDDPRYAVYFKMLKMGVPECAVKQKMVIQGIDTALLHTPDAVSELLKQEAASFDCKESTSADDDDQISTSSSDR